MNTLNKLLSYNKPLLIITAPRGKQRRDVRILLSDSLLQERTMREESKRVEAFKTHPLAAIGDVLMLAEI